MPNYRNFSFSFFYIKSIPLTAVGQLIGPANSVVWRQINKLCSQRVKLVLYFFFSWRRAEMSSNSHLLLSIVVVVITLNVVVAVQTSPTSKPFKRVAACNGSDVCASDAPSVGFTLDQIGSGVGARLPSSIRCVAMCKIDQPCVGVNYHSDTDECQLFYFTPNSFAFMPACVYFEVRCLIYRGRVHLLYALV